VAETAPDDLRREVAWSAPAGWLGAEGDYEGGAFWMWNEALLNRYREPLGALWAAGRAP